MFKENILIIDTDSLNLDLLKIPFSSGSYSYIFIWDEALFLKRCVSLERKKFIYEALTQVADLVLIVNDSEDAVEFLQESYSESKLFYASRFCDRFKEKRLEEIEFRTKTAKISPLPRGFFSFYKKIRSLSKYKEGE